MYTVGRESIPSRRSVRCLSLKEGGRALRGRHHRDQISIKISGRILQTGIGAADGRYLGSDKSEGLLDKAITN